MLLSVQLNLSPGFIPGHERGKQDREECGPEGKWDDSPLCDPRITERMCWWYMLDYQLLSCLASDGNQCKTLTIRCFRLLFEVFLDSRASNALPLQEPQG